MWGGRLLNEMKRTKKENKTKQNKTKKREQKIAAEVRREDNQKT
jgi:hypothetical protein